MTDKKLLYEKVKWVEGENFITIEDASGLTEHEFEMLASGLAQEQEERQIKSLSILLSPTQSERVVKILENYHFTLHDERVIFRNDLQEGCEGAGEYLLSSLLDISESEFMAVWQQSMTGSSNASSSLNMKEQMASVKKELGPGYEKTCLVAYERGEAIGVVMPHIEPGTKEEGRIFYFGLVPEARGSGKSVPLYKQGLKLLKEQFHATYSIGATSVNNQPMIQVFRKSGCYERERVRVYKKERNSMS
ncbi:GNAT family N-acetyltransferase [Halobacillus fulvus]|nr:GNAT family N-acetyltransferase [Halobacillus fulvus]